jgi:hypothetical protein
MTVLNLGVTGHRTLADVDQVMERIEQVINHLTSAFPGTTFRVLSSLAEGADRLVAKRFLRLPGSRLEVPLPLPEEDYLQDFSTPGSRQEFHSLLTRAGQVITLPPQPSREAAYLAAGIYILDHCDCLVAVWDGHPARGMGGTGEIVSLARDKELPMAWIIAEAGSPGGEKGNSVRVKFERFPGTVGSI